MKRNIYIVAYDVESDSTRTKIAGNLLRYGNRVQYSVFEVRLSKSELEDLERKIRNLINPKTDRVKIYSISESSYKNTKRFGNLLTLGIIYDLYL